MNLYFFMAVFWFVLGVALLVIPRINPNALDLTLPGTNFSLAWFTFVLVLYNLARWNLARASRRRMAEEGGRRFKRRPVNPSGPPPEPNPDFNFDDPTPPGGEKGKP